MKAGGIYRVPSRNRSKHTFVFFPANYLQCYHDSNEVLYLTMFGSFSVHTLTILNRLLFVSQAYTQLGITVAALRGH